MSGLARSSGILLHPTSLPAPFGIGDFGDEARAFVDFLAAGGQTLWQGLPLGPTGYGNSPYQALSAFAGNSLLISPQSLIADSLLAAKDAAASLGSPERIDHFRGFESCWEIPRGELTTERGQWVPAPGRELFKALTEALGTLPIIAENLGVITPEVESLREEFGFPGMRVLQFAFGSDRSNVHLPHNYAPNVVAYTGTHDNDTTVGWFADLSSGTKTGDATTREREFCLEYLKSNEREIHWDFIRVVLESVADTAIIPLQDVLGLGSEARMNLPASTSGNWKWRFQAGRLTDELAGRMKELTKLSGRMTS